MSKLWPSDGCSAASGHPPISDTAVEAAWMVGGLSIRCNCFAAAHRNHQLANIQCIDEGINHANGIALIDEIIEALRQQRRLRTIRPCNKALHPFALENHQENLRAVGESPSATSARSTPRFRIESSERLPGLPLGSRTKWHFQAATFDCRQICPSVGLRRALSGLLIGTSRTVAYHGGRLLGGPDKSREIQCLAGSLGAP